MSLSKPATRNELKEYCLMKLGKGAIDINVTDEQVEMAIDETLQMYYEYHYDGTRLTYMRYRITEQDKLNAANLETTYTTTDPNSGQTFTFEDGKVYLWLPDTVIAVEGIWRMASTYGYNIFNYEYQFFLNDFYTFYSYDILNYYMTKEYISTLQFLLQGDKQVRYNHTSNKLYIDLNWDYVDVGSYLIIQCHLIADPNEYPRIYNERFNKTYLELLIKKQWGANLMKYDGIKLPDGRTLNGEKIYKQAEADIEKFRQRIPYDYAFLPLALIG